MQSVINNKPAGGMVGEFYSTQLKTQHTFTSGSTITVGNAVTFDAVDPNKVNQGGTGLFAGILTEPKNYVMFNNLNPQLSIPAGISAHVGRGGYIWVYFTTTASRGQAVYFDNTTGELGTGTASAGETQINGATVFIGGEAGTPCVVYIPYLENVISTNGGVTSVNGESGDVTFDVVNTINGEKGTVTGFVKSVNNVDPVDGNVSLTQSDIPSE